MGGCASKPKDMHFSQATLPAETSTSAEPIVKHVQSEVPAQENDNGGESPKEEPLVDISEPNDPNPEAPKSDEDASESKNAIADLISGIGEQSDVNHATAKQIEEDVGLGAANNTSEQTKDGPEVEELAGQIAVDSHKSDVTGH